jgi:transposase
MASPYSNGIECARLEMVMKVTTIGLDLAKSVFTMEDVDEHGHTVLRKTVRRAKLLEQFAVAGVYGGDGSVFGSATLGA